MEELVSLRDFMLIVTSGESCEDFHPRIHATLELAVATCPEAALRAEFDVGAREHVEVFSAPDFETARRIADNVNAMRGVRAELAPLRNRW
jgi:hypothetical protein